MNGSGNPAKKGMDLRLQYILSLLTGPLLLAIGGTERAETDEDLPCYGDRRSGASGAFRALSSDPQLPAPGFADPLRRGGNAFLAVGRAAHIRAPDAPLYGGLHGGRRSGRIPLEEKDAAFRPDCFLRRVCPFHAAHVRFRLFAEFRTDRVCDRIRASSAGGGHSAERRQMESARKRAVTRLFA